MFGHFFRLPNVVCFVELLDFQHEFRRGERLFAGIQLFLFDLLVNACFFVGHEAVILLALFEVLAEVQNVHLILLPLLLLLLKQHQPRVPKGFALQSLHILREVVGLKFATLYLYGFLEAWNAFCRFITSVKCRSG